MTRALIPDAEEALAGAIDNITSRSHGMSWPDGFPPSQIGDSAAPEVAGVLPLDDSDGVGTVARRPRPVDRLAEVAQLDGRALRAAWAALFGRVPPESLSRRLLEYAASYHAQAKIYGGLKPALRRRLVQAARPRATDGPPLPRKPARVLTPGSRLVREWHGRSYTVEVAQNGFLYAGRHYRSLSEVAWVITGAQWSGPRFFGL
jgi:hypothetical protein